MAKNAAELEQLASFEVEDAQQPIPPLDIVAYNELRSCADLCRLHSTGKLEVQPDFQREVVWSTTDQTRFIDSLVKQLPIPSMCFSLDYKTQKWKVIDGLQRMSSIIAFLSEPVSRLASLPDIHPRLRGATNIELRTGDAEQRRLYAMVEDVSIPVTVIRCDYSQPSHMNYLFTIFHRLNSGGVRLTNQEIRNCIYTGSFNDLLKEFDKSNKQWQQVSKRIWGSMDRFRSIEVLLRVLAFTDKFEEYDGNLARFLNEYMQSRSRDSEASLATLRPKLEHLAEKANSVLQSEYRRKLSLAFVEALLVGIYSNLDVLGSAPPENLVAAYKTLIADEVFSESARYAVSSVENVRNRLGLAKRTFLNAG